MIKIIINNFCLFILLTFSGLIYAEDVNNPEKEKKVFDENLPAQISETNAEFIYKFLLAEIATQRGELNSAGHMYLDLAKLTKSIPKKLVVLFKN